MQDDKKNKLAQNFFFLGIVQIINVLLQLLVIPYVIKIIGVDGFGVVAVAQVVMLFLSALTDYGFNQTATKDISLNRTDKTAISKIFYRALFSRLLLCFLSFLLLVILVICVPLFRSNAYLYFMAFVFVVGQSLFVNWFFQGLEKMQFIALLTLLARVVFVVLVFAFIKNKEDGILFLFFWGTGSFVAGITGIYIAHHLLSVQFIKPGRADIIRELKEGWHVTAANLSIYACQYLNLIILRIFTNDLVAGYYGIAERIFSAMKQGLAIFSQVIYPKVCRLIQKGRSQLILFFRQTYFPFLLLVTAGCVLVFILSSPILYFFIGHKSENSVFLLRVLCAVLIIICMNIPAWLVLLATNEKKSFLRITVIGTLLNIISNIILVHFWGAKGTVISILITEIFITTGLCREVYRLYFHDKNEQEIFFKSVFHESK